jgi:hypothetical protein
MIEKKNPGGKRQIMQPIRDRKKKELKPEADNQKSGPHQMPQNT